MQNPSTLPTPTSLKERDDSPSLQSLATVKKSLEDSQQLQLRELHLHDLQSWFVFYNIISQHLLNNLNKANEDNKKLMEQVAQLQVKVESLQVSIGQSTTTDEIQSYKKHCLDLITPATACCIMKELGFPAVKEIPNSGNIASLLSCGVIHRSPFAQQWFAISQGQDSTITGVSIKKFANDTSNKLFWTKPLAVPTVAQVQVKCNGFTKYIHDILAMQFFHFQMLKNLQTKTCPRVKILNLHWSKPSMGIMMQVVKVLTPPPPPPPPMFPLSGGLFLSTQLPTSAVMTMIHGLPSSFQSWLAFYSTMLEHPLLFLPCNKDVTIFQQSNVRNVVAKLAGKTTRMVLQQVVYEALTHLITIKTIFTSFKGHSNLFIDLLKKCSLPNPNLNLCGAMDEEQFLCQHYIANVSASGGYSTQDIEHFINLHNKIKDEHRLDKIHEGPEVGGIRKFTLAFIAPASVAASPIVRSTCCWASMLASPSSQSSVAMGVMMQYVP